MHVLSARNWMCKFHCQKKCPQSEVNGIQVPVVNDCRKWHNHVDKKYNANRRYSTNNLVVIRVLLLEIVDNSNHVNYV